MVCVNECHLIAKTLSENILIQVSVVSASFSVTAAGVSLPPHDAMGLEHVLMEVMR